MFFFSLLSASLFRYCFLIFDEVVLSLSRRGGGEVSVGVSQWRVFLHWGIESCLDLYEAQD